MTRTGIALFVAVLCCLTISLVEAKRHSCNHKAHTRGIKLRPPRLSKAKARTLALAGTVPARPLEIQFEYSDLRYFPDEKASFIMNHLMPAVKKFFQGILSLNTPLTPWTFQISECNKKYIPNHLRGKMISADLVIFVSSQYAKEGTTVAWASACDIHPKTYRPTAGLINFIEGHIKTDPRDFREMFETVVHEMIHVLGFSSNLFEHYIDGAGQRLGINNVIKNVVIRGEPTKWVITRQVKEFTQRHFSCYQVEGAELENQGDPGAHWERRNFMNEIMTATLMEDAILSELTLKLLESTGWYIVNYAGAQELLWAKGAGCPFLQQPCLDKITGVPIYEGFCKEFEIDGCSRGHYNVGHCNWITGSGSVSPNFIYHVRRVSYDPYADNCPYFTGYKNGDCRDKRNQNSKDEGLYNQAWGPSSRCFAGNYVKPKALERWVLDTNADGSLIKQHGACHTYKCIIDSTYNKPAVQITVDGSVITCPYYGGQQRIPGYNGYIVCPNGEKFCTEEVKNECGWSNHCNAAGFCWRNQCVCGEGTKGYGCGELDCKTTTCNNRGMCSNGKCQCFGGYGGAECEKEYIKQKCGGCTSGMCQGEKCVSFDQLFA